MQARWKPKLNKSLLQNATPLLSFLYDQFVSHKERVIRYPRQTAELHLMRIDGKPLRYMIELFEPIFSRQFRNCIQEVKDLLELLGTIHDCDVTIPILLNHLREVRLYNKTLPDREGRFTTRGIQNLIRQQREERGVMFQRMRLILEKWETENFKEKLLRSMKT